MSRFEEWKALTAKTEGFFHPEAAATWDALLEHQRASAVSGSIAEIGVYRGKSASLAALHLAEREKLFLVDLDFPPETRRLLEAVVPASRIRYEAGRSSRLPGVPDALALARACRWVHVDGEHTGQAAANDLAVASLWLDDAGVVCMDDFFNPAYPQITAAVFQYLSAHPFELTLFLCGHNKGYLCRPTAAHGYLSMIATRLAKDLADRGIRDVTLFKTTHASDMNCFGAAPRFRDLDYYGLDSDPSKLPL